MGYIVFVLLLKTQTIGGSDQVMQKKKWKQVKPENKSSWNDVHHKMFIMRWILKSQKKSGLGVWYVNQAGDLQICQFPFGLVAALLCLVMQWVLAYIQKEPNSLYIAQQIQE